MPVCSSGIRSGQKRKGSQPTPIRQHHRKAKDHYRPGKECRPYSEINEAFGTRKKNYYVRNPLRDPRKAWQSNQKQAKRRGLLTKGVFFLYDNARPHTAARTVQVHQNFKWENLKHPWYNLDIASNKGQYHLFQLLKNRLGSKSLDDSEELKDTVKDWPKSLGGRFLYMWYEKLVSRYEKCIDGKENYVGKSLSS